jgi:hypothetical protein
MPANNYPPLPTFDQAFNQSTGHRVSTPFGIVSILNNGRRVIIDLYPDVRQSIHHKALFSYVNNVLRLGVDSFNVSHIFIDGADPALELKRGKSIIDFVYMKSGRIHEVELKTHREIGLDITAKQLKDLALNCQNLILAVPRLDAENASTVLNILGIAEKVKVDYYATQDTPSDYQNDY